MLCFSMISVVNHQGPLPLPCSDAGGGLIYRPIL